MRNSFSKVATTLPCLKVLVGDFNIDMSWEFDLQAFFRGPEPEQVKSDRLQFRAWAKDLDCVFSFSPPPVDGPGGPFSSECCIIPYTRVPQGLACSTQNPSILDYCVASQSLDPTSFLTWSGVAGDHALSSSAVSWKVQPRKRAKTHWHVHDEQEALQDLHNNPLEFESKSQFCDFWLSFQEKHKCTLSSRDRRANKVPFVVRDLQNKARNIADPALKQ